MTQPTSNNTAPEFAIQRVYLKDASFEAPNTPDIFRVEWQPTVDVDLQTQTTQLSEAVYEVALGVTATAKVHEKAAFLVEVKMAGIFTLQHFPQDQLNEMLGVVCPSIIFPYVREAVCDLVVRGSFPQMHLEPVNFQALYLQNLQQQGEVVTDEVH